MFAPEMSFIAEHFVDLNVIYFILMGAVNS
jgi:hypothetical protein